MVELQVTVRLGFGLSFGLWVESRQLEDGVHLERRRVGEGVRNRLREIEVAIDRTEGDKVFWRCYIQNLILFYIELNFHIAKF